MARSSYGKLLGWGLAIGAVAGALSLFRDKAGASTVPVVPRAPAAKGPKQKFSPGDEVTVTGGPVGTDRTFIVRSATLTPTGWQYDLGEGAPMPQGAMHFVSSAADRASVPVSPVMIKAAPVEFSETITHSPEFLAREKAAKVAAKAAPIQGGPNMTQRQQRITELLGLVKTEKDAAKKQALAEELKKLAQEESAALKAAPTTPQPVYPLGMEASFGGKWVKILKAWQDGRGAWFYEVDAKLGMPLGFGDGVHTLSEADIRSKLGDALGQLAPGQAYPKGISIFRNKQGGTVTAAIPGAGGTWNYQIQSWPNVVGQDELLAILRRA